MGKGNLPYHQIYNFHLFQFEYKYLSVLCRIQSLPQFVGDAPLNLMFHQITVKIERETYCAVCNSLVIVNISYRNRDFLLFLDGIDQISFSYQNPTLKYLL